MSTLFLNRRMDYSDAIKYLKEHDIKKEDGTYYEFGEVPVIKYTCNKERNLLSGDGGCTYTTYFQ